MNPLISIIVPVYNTEKYLDQCIQSVLAQTYTNWEILLIDDGSTDSSGAICDRYAEQGPRIRVFHKENSGVSSARNLGLDNARGEWITFVDSDDILYSHALLTLLSFSNEVDIVTATIEQDSHIWAQSYIGVLNSEKYIKGLLDGSCYGFPVATLYRSTIFRHPRTVITSDIRIGEDVLFKIDIARYINKAINITDVLYWYRTNPSSAMQTQVRSVQYYIRYFELRNSLISENLAQHCILQDIKSLLSAFFNPNIPYREYDYQALIDIICSLDSEILKNQQIKKQVTKLRHKPIVILRKSFYYYRTQLIRCFKKKPKLIILK